MPDIIDDAQEIADRERERQIAAARGGRVGQGTVECVDCDCEIPISRRAARPGATRCIDCQEALESGAPHMGRRA